LPSHTTFFIWSGRQVPVEGLIEQAAVQVKDGFDQFAIVADGIQP
jgi:hypothetical protein